jgi:hypothetical protein
MVGYWVRLVVGCHAGDNVAARGVKDLKCLCVTCTSSHLNILRERFPVGRYASVDAAMSEDPVVLVIRLLHFSDTVVAASAVRSLSVSILQRSKKLVRLLDALNLFTAKD